MTWDIFAPLNEKRRQRPPFHECYQGLRLLDRIQPRRILSRYCRRPRESGDPWIPAFAGMTIRRRTTYGGGLLQRGERLLGVLRERMLGLLLDEIREAGGGARPVSHRRARERGAEHGVGGERALRARLEERLERLGGVGEVAGVGERLRLLERFALAGLLAIAAPVGLELRLGRLGAAQSGGDGHPSGGGLGARRRGPQAAPQLAEHVFHRGRLGRLRSLRGRG